MRFSVVNAPSIGAPRDRAQTARIESTPYDRGIQRPRQGAVPLDVLIEQQRQRLQDDARSVSGSPKVDARTPTPPLDALTGDPRFIDLVHELLQNMSRFLDVLIEQQQDNGRTTNPPAADTRPTMSLDALLAQQRQRLQNEGLSVDVPPLAPLIEQQRHQEEPHSGGDLPLDVLMDLLALAPGVGQQRHHDEDRPVGDLPLDELMDLVDLAPAPRVDQQRHHDDAPACTPPEVDALNPQPTLEGQAPTDNSRRHTTPPVACSPASSIEDRRAHPSALQRPPDPQPIRRGRADAMPSARPQRRTRRQHAFPPTSQRDLRLATRAPPRGSTARDIFSCNAPLRWSTFQTQRMGRPHRRGCHLRGPPSREC